MPIEPLKERWKYREMVHTEVPEIDAFLADIATVCEKHQMTLGHEDSHGAFQVESYSEENLEWLRQAFDCRSGPRR